MSTTDKRDILKRLLLTTPDNGVVCATCLVESGFSHDNLKQYVRGGYLDAIGRGAYCKHGHRPPLAASLAAAVDQLKVSVHLGGWSALSLHGLLHFLPAGERPSTLYAKPNERLPAWLVKAYGERFECRRTALLPVGVGVGSRVLDGFRVPVSSPERAILEYMLDVPDSHPLNEAYQIMEMMLNARPDVFQSLLEHCASVKVKRLFCLLAEDLNMPWFEDLKLDRIDFGSGNRLIEPGGTFRSKWMVTVKDWKDI